MFTFQFVLDIDKDIKNWVDGCNKISHGKDWKKSILPEYKEIADRLVGCTYEEAEIFMIPFLTSLYKKHEKEIENTIVCANKIFTEKFKEACLCMEGLTKYPLYRNDFTLFLTTFPRGPYEYEKGFVRLSIFWNVKNYLGMFLHELQHFQVIHYYKSEYMKNLTIDQFEFLKESLTIILNVTCKEFLGKSDDGYQIHKEFRENILKYWNKAKDFKKTIEYGVRKVKEYI